MRSASGPAHARILLYGIYDLNQAQEALVAGLLDAGADLFVPIPRGGSGAGASALEAARAAGLAEQRREAPAADAEPRATRRSVARVAAGSTRRSSRSAARTAR